MSCMVSHARVHYSKLITSITLAAYIYQACNLGKGEGYTAMRACESTKDITANDFPIKMDACCLGDPDYLVSE